MEQALGTARQAALRRPPPSPRWPKAARTAAAACVLAITAAVTGCAQQANAAAPIQVGTAYVTLPAASGSTQAYLIIQNNGSADRVTSARTSVGGLVTFRGPAGHGGSVLRTVPDIVVPARATVRLVPDGYHLLITGAHRMRAGTEITLTLVFARAGKMSVAALVTNPETGGSSYLGDLCAGGRDLTVPPRGLSFTTSRYIVLMSAQADRAADQEDHMTTGPDLRIGDSDREAAAAFLREHYATGRLTFEEFSQRLDATFAARTRGQLNRITRDLPHVGVPAAARPLASADAPRRERARQDYRSAPPHGPRILPAIIAAVTAVLVLGLLVPHLWLFPGKIAIFMAVFALVRGLVRRVWRQGSGVRGGVPRGGFPRGGR